MTFENKKRERLVNDVCNGDTKWARTLFDLLSEVAYSDKAYFRSPKNKQYECPPYFCNIFTRIASYHNEENNTDYKKLRKILKNWNSAASFDDLEFFFYAIKNSTTSISPEQQQRIFTIYGILAKLALFEHKRMSYLDKCQKKFNISNIHHLNKDFLLYILDENHTSIASINVSDFDSLLNEF